MEQNQILGYLGGLFQKNAPITDEVFSALKECLKPRNLDTNDYVSGETVRIRAAIDSLGFRHGKNLNAYVEYQENEGEAPFVFLTIESARSCRSRSLPRRPLPSLPSCAARVPSSSAVRCSARSWAS